MTSSGEWLSKGPHSRIAMGWKALACVWGLLLTLPVLGMADAVRFNIGAQPLPAALKAFAAQANMQLLYRHDAVKGATANEVIGDFEKRTALEMLLKDTGLEVVYSNGNAATIRPVRTASKPTAAHRANTNSQIRLAQSSSGAREGAGNAGATTDQSPPTPSPSGADVPEGITLDEIVVIGTRLNKAQVAGKSPVTILSSANISRSGASTLNELFKLLPQASVTPDSSSLFDSNIRGASSVQLRGLPFGTTLVLVNGRRVTTSGISGSFNFFDLSNIPISAVERVEVLTDGASAVYGADAIGGVVNVLLKHDLVGISVDAGFGATDDGGGTERRASLSGGLRAGPIRISGLVDFLDREPIFGGQRARLRSADFRDRGLNDQRFSFVALPGTVYALPGSGNLPGINASFAGIPPVPPSTPLTPASFQSTAGVANLDSTSVGSSYLFGTENAAGMVSATIDLWRSGSAYVELMYSDRETTGAVSSFNALFGGAFGLNRITSGNPFNPFQTTIAFEGLIGGIGPAQETVSTDFDREVIGLRSQIGSSSWSWDFALLRMRERTEHETSNLLSRPRARAALLATDPATAINVFTPGPAASAGVLAGLIGPPTLNRFDSEGRQVSAELRGDLVEGWAGMLAGVVGAEARKEDFESATIFGVPFSGDRDSESFFAEILVPLIDQEMRVPLVRELTGFVAGRHDHYSDFGDTTNPQLGLKWSLNKTVMLRLSAGTSFRAPPLTSLFSPQTTTPITVIDTRRGNERLAVSGRFGGNPDLTPEEGDTYNVGIVFALGADSSISLDRWGIRYNDRIGTPPAQLLTTIVEDIAPGVVTRAAPSPADIAAGRPGPITAVDLRNRNLGEIDVSGVDLRAAHEFDVVGGSLELSIGATRALDYDSAVVRGAAPEDRLSKAAGNGFAPKWKAVGAVSWSTPKWNVAVTARYTGAYRDYVIAGAPAPQTIDAQTRLDAQLAREITLPGTHVRLTVGATNLLDDQPPYSLHPGGFDPAQYDLRGRFSYARLSIGF